MAIRVKTPAEIAAENIASADTGPARSGHDFTTDDDTKLQTCILIHGDGGTGKTTFAVEHAPSPVALISLDQRYKWAVKRARENGRQVFVAEIAYPGNINRMTDEAVMKLGNATIEKVMRNIEWASRESEKGNIRTIAIDTGTEYTELLSLAFRGKARDVKDYGKTKDLMNQEWWKVFRLAKEGLAHLIVLSRSRAVWVGGEPSGRFTYRVPDVVNDAADWTAEIRLNKKSLRRRGAEKTFEIEVQKGGVSVNEIGEVYAQEDWEGMGVSPFVYACMLQYVGSSEEDWK